MQMKNIWGVCLSVCLNIRGHSCTNCVSVFELWHLSVGTNAPSVSTQSAGSKGHGMSGVYGAQTVSTCASFSVHSQVALRDTA